MRQGSQVGITACSNGQSPQDRMKLTRLEVELKRLGLHPVWSPYIYQKETLWSGTGQERAQALMRLYQDPKIEAIFDISGGDLANEILPYLDFQVIGQNPKQLWGYSDLTALLNAVYAQTGQSCVLYQIRNLIREKAETQNLDFRRTIFGNQPDLFTLSYRWLQGRPVQGVVVGGNIRCLLKLAGTPYWPDLTDKILLLEAMSGGPARMTAYFSQLSQLGAFRQAKGILLGTFIEMESQQLFPAVPELIRRFTGPDLPIAKTEQVGHGPDSKGVVIGEKLVESVR